MKSENPLKIEGKNTREILMLALLIFCNILFAQRQENLNLETCRQLARKNYPLLKQSELITRSSELKSDNAGSAYLPQLGIFGQATYQSAVTALPIKLPGVEVPELSKDQYRIYAELNQVLFDGGVTKQQKTLQQLSGITENYALEVELYKVLERVNQFYFSILFLEEQKKQVELTIEDIDANLKKVSSAVKNGIALKSNEDQLRAEFLKMQQKLTEVKSNKKINAELLGFLIGQELNENLILSFPQQQESTAGSRPEIRLIDQQQRNLDVQRELIKARNLPRFSFFVQGGIGRPALNMLSNTIEPYYIGGLRLSWNLAGYYNSGNEKKLIELNRQNLEIQKEVFHFNNKFVVKQQSTEVAKLQELLKTDKEIIELRENIRKSASTQLSEGVITSSDYLRELNSASQAKEAMLLHELQLLAAQYAAQHAQGEKTNK